MASETLENKTKLVNLYDPNGPKVQIEDHRAIYELYGSVKENPKKFYWQGKIGTENNRIVCLDASEIGLTYIPKGICNLKNLKELWLYENQIKTLPKNIGNLDNLEELYLWGNQIKTLPKNIGNLKKLRTLNLNDNQIKTIPENIRNLKNLKGLYLLANPLDEKSKEILEELNSKGVSVGY